MEVKRKPFQGILNIVRFNWHFYVIAGSLIVALLIFVPLFSSSVRSILYAGVSLAAITMLTSLLVSIYVYDLSDLYLFSWLDGTSKIDTGKILTVNAGFDETTPIIEGKFKNMEVISCDFYDPTVHTEISIKRARKAYPLNPKAVIVNTGSLPFSESTFDMTFAIFSVHEIRDAEERLIFFKELNRVTKLSGQIFVTEHLRDFANFLAYNVGFFHFYSRKNWMKIFREANLTVRHGIKTTPFVTTFILEKNGDPL